MFEFVDETQFQFQYGAGKSVTKPGTDTEALSFQFQYGAGKRKQEIRLSLFYSHFNSNMVRVKVMESGQKPTSFCDFNSNMVRVKDYRLSDTVSRFFKFQFQYGAGKRAFALGFGFITCIFQFQYGAGKRQNFLFTRVILLNFNSNMVRVKVIFVFHHVVIRF